MAGIQTKDGGTITYRSYSGGVGYSIYVPSNVNTNTPIFTYTYGGGKKSDWYSGYHDYGNYGIYDALMENGSDSIVIMPDMDWGAAWGENTIGIINSVREEYDITNLNVSGSGFSMGGFGGFEAVAENIRQNPNLDPQVVFFVDDYSDTYYQISKELTENGRAELFAQNNTVLFAYDPWWKSPDNYQLYLDAGINVVRVEPQNFDHVAINANFFKNGIYDYMNGASLPQEGYIYKIYNRETGSWEEIEYNKIATVDRLYDYYNVNTLQSKINRLSSLSGYVIKSDSGVIEHYLNSIVGAIKSASFLNSDIGDFAGSSTTNVPSEIPSCVRRHFINNAKVIDKLISLMDAVAEIDPAYQEADQTLLSMMNN